jgi:hypothetical protein
MYYDHLWFLLALLFIFGWAGLVMLAKYLKTKNRSRKREMIHKERMLAMEKGVPLGELPDHLSQDENGGPDSYLPNLNGEWDRKIALGSGLVLLFGGIGMALGFFLIPETKDTEGLQALASMGLIPMLIGVGLLIYYGMNRPKT